MSVIATPTNAGDEDQRSVWLNPSESVSVEYAQLNRDGSGGETLTEAAWDPERGVYQVDIANLTAVGAPPGPAFGRRPATTTGTTDTALS